MIELLIGAAVAAGVGRYIIKGYSATGVLMVGGLLLLGISALMGKTLLPSGCIYWLARDRYDRVRQDFADEPRRRSGHDDHDAVRFRRLYDAYRRQRRGRQAGLAPIADDQFALSADGGGLFCRLPDVIGGLFRYWTWRIADGDAVPIDGERWH